MGTLSVTESGIGSSATDLDLPDGYTGRINFSPLITGAFDLVAWGSGIPTSDEVVRTDLPIAGGSYGIGKASAELSAVRMPDGRSAINAGVSLYGMKFAGSAKGSFSNIEMETPELSTPIEARAGVLGFSIGAGLVPSASADGLKTTFYVDLAIIGLEITWKNEPADRPTPNTDALRERVKGVDSHNDIVRGFIESRVETGGSGWDKSLKEMADQLMDVPSSATPGKVSAGATKVVQTPAGPKVVKVLETIQTPAGPKVVWNDSHYIPPDGKGSSGSNSKGSGGGPDDGTRGSGGGRPDNKKTVEVKHYPDAILRNVGQKSGSDNDSSTSKRDSYTDKYSGTGGGGADSGSRGNQSSGGWGSKNSGSEKSGSGGSTTKRDTYTDKYSGTGGGGADSGSKGSGGNGGSAGSGPKNNGNISSGNANHYDRVSSGKVKGGLPILLDLDGDGIQITELDRSTRFVDGGKGLLHRTAWAATGNGVLFFDPDGRNAITEERQYVFTAWNPTASGDLEALRSIWDTNGDGKLTAADAEFAKFKVLVTNADGSTTVMTLAQLGITEINLTADATNIVLPDGSAITGQTTFTRSNGTTGTVANTTLVREVGGHRVVEVTSTDAAGNRVVVSTAYDADGSVAFTVKSVTNPAGTLVTNSYDDNGDGVVDRIQVITKVTNGDGSKTETLVNKVGADAATAITVNRTVTTVSADGKVVTIERDSEGGGWFDQREVRTTNADGSRTTVISDLAQSGAVIKSSSETVSVNGRTRAEGVDADGNGTTDTTTTHTITVAGNNSRTEVTTVANGDGSLRAGETEMVSSDGRVRTVVSDLDGDGDTDRTDEMAITVAVGGTTTSVATVKNGDGSVRSSSSVVQSADALVKTKTSDVDGDGDTDVTVADAVVISADGSRVTTMTLTNTDGSVRGLQKVTLGADKVTSETWVDQNQDGVFQATDLVKSVTVDAGTLARTATIWDRNADGTVQSKTVSVTSADGLSTTTTIDADGDGDTDTTVSDVTVYNAGVATRTVQTTNQNGSLRSREVTTTSADGLTVTRDVDIDGNGTTDGRTVDARLLGSDGSVTRTVSEYAGNGTTLTGRSVTVESADRRVMTVTTDRNGDGFTDRVSSSIEASDGSKTITETAFLPNGTVSSRSVSTVSANGLVATTAVNADGKYTAETWQTDTTVLGADGSRTRTVDVKNGHEEIDSPQSNRTLAVNTVSDDGLVVTSQTDANGDGVFERTSSSVTVLNANGSVTKTDQVLAANAAVLSRAQSTVSDDGLVTIQKSDADGDGDFDLTTTQTTTLLDDGGSRVSTELRDAANALRNKTTSTTSDDGRSVTVAVDVNGDGQTDRMTTRIVADDGMVTEASSNLSATGNLQSITSSSVSDDGLISRTDWDLNGDGVYERKSETSIVLNADGSKTETMISKGANDVSYNRSVIVTSDDGLSSTRSDDFNGNGTTELTTVMTSSLASNGVKTQSVVHKATNNAVIDSMIVVTSADGRTVTETFDADGNGVNDRATTTTVANTGEVTSSTNFLSVGGAVEATRVVTVSGDGLIKTTALDRNGDGQVDLESVDQTILSADGYVTRSMTYTNERNQIVARETSSVSDDGTSSTVSLDLNGDGVSEFNTEITKTFAANGDVVLVQSTKDGTADTISEIRTTTSGSGLQSTVVTDFSGDGITDRLMSLTRLADGSWTETTTLYHPGTTVLESQTASMSADGRTLTTTRDLNGDGVVDRTVLSTTDLFKNSHVDYKDIKQDGIRGALIKESIAANGMVKTYGFDLDDDNKFDFARDTRISFNADGSSVETFYETYNVEEGLSTTGAENVFSYAAEYAIYREVTTRSANGLQSITQIDADGVSGIDATMTDTTTINVDGSRTILSETRYADGSLRARQETKVSADRRTTTSTSDYDGNGIADKTSESRLLSDGSTVAIDNSFGQGGAKIQTFVTTTSSDGLVTKTMRGTTEQTITRSAADLDSYTWNNGVTASTTATNVVVSHQFDALGIETWTMTSKTYVGTTLQTSVSSVRLDAAAKAKLLAEAARIFDTVLDRDLDITEIEMLVPKIANGQLDEVALATQLLTSPEFAARYGTLTNAEFVTQIYLNALGRVPSLAELSDNLTALASNAITRAKMSVGVSEGIEHVVVGNGHMSTNNFDVIMNPAVFDRSLDAVYVRTIVERLVDVVYDRAATAQELRHLTDLLMRDVSNPDDIATLLLGVSGDIQGQGTNSLFGLTGATLVQQGFANALHRAPTALEQATWEAHLSSSRITVAQFVASLAQSKENLASWQYSTVRPVPSVTTTTGTSSANTLTGTAGQDSIGGLGGNDTLTGGQGADLLNGGTGVDSLDGGIGNDIYEWKKGDGNDTINDTGVSLTEVDRLRLIDVTSGEVTLTRATGSNNLVIKIGASEQITVTNRFTSVTSGVGLEAISFSDGVTWTFDDILARTNMNGAATADTLTGTAYRDNIFGLAGNDTLIGGDGADRLIGGAGVDLLWGGAATGAPATNGSDTYVWTKGDGNDTINDWGRSLTEVDTLELTDVTSSQVALSFSNAAGADLLITIVPTGEVIRIDERYQAIADGFGIEKILFSDGVIWTLEDLLARTSMNGTATADTLTGTAYRDNLYGLAGNDTLNGLAGNDVLLGGDGNDRLDGGAGTDSLTGGAGNDIYVVDATTDVIIESAAGGTDTVQSSVTLTLAAEVENLTLLGTAVINGTGNALANTVTGNSAANSLSGRAGNDTLVGGDGNDTLDGGAGTDSLTGGAGNDTYVVDATTDVIVEAAAGGTDTVQSNVTLTLGTEVENLTLLGTAVINGTGNAVANTLTGNSAANSLSGLAGNDTLLGGDGDDTLDGGAGTDSLTGGAGNDTYVVDATTDVIVEVAAGGTDTVKSSVTLTLGTEVENLTLLGTAVINATGNDVANTLIGNAGVNSLSGLLGNDVLLGLAGNDTLLGGDGNDTLDGGAGNDALTGGVGADVFVFSANFGADQIQTLSTIDRIDLSAVDTITSFGDLVGSHLTQTGADLLISDGLGNTVLIKTMTIGALTADHFIF
jgi:Ca2+-binding RTX toxin-like protein